MGVRRGKIPWRGVGQVNGALDAVAKAEFLGELDGEAVGGKHAAVGADAFDQFAAVMRQHLGLHRLHDVRPAEVLGGVMAAIAVFVVWYFITTQRAQKAIAAGQAYTQLELNLPPTETVQQVADAFLKIASDYPGTLSAQRAQLQAANLLFGAGRYEDAQAAFQQFLDANSGSPLFAAAQFGVAASLEAENKLDLAAAAYRTVTASYPNSPEALSAQFSLGRTLEAQGKLTEATGYYQGVMRAP
jgi:tetratricopeptide (TPR) repeat protein